VAFVHSLHVAAGTERAAVAGDHHNAHVVVFGQRRQDPTEPLVHRVAERVTPLGSVERDHADVSVNVGEQVSGSGIEFARHDASLAAPIIPLRTAAQL
jgi:hypothetical protein